MLNKSVPVRMSDPKAWTISRESEVMTDCSKVTAEEKEQKKSDYTGAAAHRFNSMKVTGV